MPTVTSVALACSSLDFMGQRASLEGNLGQVQSRYVGTRKTFVDEAPQTAYQERSKPPMLTFPD